MWASALPAPTFPGSKGHPPPTPSQLGEKQTSEDDTFHGLDFEKGWNVIYSYPCTWGPFHGQVGNKLWTVIWSCPGTWTHCKGLLAWQAEGRLGQDCSTGNSPKGLGCGSHPRLKALDMALLILSSLPRLSPEQAKLLSMYCGCNHVLQQVCSHLSGSPREGVPIALTTAGGNCLRTEFTFNTDKPENDPLRAFT